MAGLTNVVVKDSYKSLLRVDNNTSGITGTAQQVYDGEGTSCPLYLGSSSIDIYGLLTVGTNGAGYDIKFYGATAGKYMLWDESENKLVIEGGASISGDIDVEGEATFSSDSVYLKNDGYDSGTPVKALSLNTSNGAIKVAGVEMKPTGVLKLKTLTQTAQEALTPAIGDVVMRSDDLTAKTEPYLYSD
jgi:hypothetical protein|tara:strand:- start:248 stop:814 length:567 start_codon:yes stop_codon:yes gene_type:complete